MLQSKLWHKPSISPLFLSNLIVPKKHINPQKEETKQKLQLQVHSHFLQAHTHRAPSITYTYKKVPHTHIDQTDQTQNQQTFGKTQTSEMLL